MKKYLTNFPKVVDEKHDIYFHWPNVKFLEFSDSRIRLFPKRAAK